MNAIQHILFVLALWLAGIFAIGMDPYSCGIPLLVLSLAVICGQSLRVSHSFTRWNFLVLGIICYFLCIILQSPCKDFGRSDGLLLAGCALSAWWVAGASQKQLRMTLLIALGVLVVSNVVVAVIQKSNVDFYPVYVKRATTLFPSGLYLHYNHFANFLLGAGLFGLGMALLGNVRLWMRIAYGVIFAFAAVGIMLSNSRGAYLGLGVGTITVFIGVLCDLLRRKYSWAGIALIISVVLAPVMVFGSWSLGSKMLAHRNSGDSGRLEFASIALELIGENPVLGGGSRSFFDQNVKKWNQDELWVGGGDIQYVHNEYLQAAVDYGLVGAGLLLIVFSIAFFRAVSSLAVLGTEDRSEGEILGSIGALTGMGVQAFFSFVYHVLPDVMLLGCFLSFLLLRGRRLEEADRPFLWSKKLFLGIAAVIVCMVALPDARAWWILKPGLASNDSREQLAEKYSKAIEIRPDYRLYSRASRHLLKINEADIQREQHPYRLEQALEYQATAVKRSPDNLFEQLNLALIYDSLKRFEEAEVIYQEIVDILAPREYFYGTRYHFARHYLTRGTIEWWARKPEMALFYFMQAKAQIDKVSANYIEGNVWQLQKELNECIEFLRNTKVKIPNE